MKHMVNTVKQKKKKRNEMMIHNVFYKTDKQHHIKFSPSSLI